MARVAQSLAFAAALLEECGVDGRRCFLGVAGHRGRVRGALPFVAPMRFARLHSDCTLRGGSLRVSSLIYRHSYVLLRRCHSGSLRCVVSVLINRSQMMPQRLRTNSMVAW